MKVKNIKSTPFTVFINKNNNKDIRKISVFYTYKKYKYVVTVTVFDMGSFFYVIKKRSHIKNGNSDHKIKKYKGRTGVKKSKKNESVHMERSFC